MDDRISFDLESLENIRRLSADKSITEISQEWIDRTAIYRYVYNWCWMGLPIIQLPADVVVLQELVWRVKPTVIIETGIARGGSLVLNASQLAMLDLCNTGSVTLVSSGRMCIGVDVEIREHNRAAIEAHPLAPMIRLIEGSSTDETTVASVKRLLRPEDIVMLILDSNHTHDHVIAELNAYSSLVSIGSYLVVHDTGIEYAPTSLFAERSWGPGNNPLTAVAEFLKSNPEFEIDPVVCGKLQITSSPGGYLRRLR